MKLREISTTMLRGLQLLSSAPKEKVVKESASYDVIFDCVAMLPLRKCKKALAPNGTYLNIMKELAVERTEDLVFLKELAEAGKIKPVIDRRYPLEKTADAHRYVETGRKRGNVVISVR